jgi:hypothetical protein
VLKREAVTGDRRKVCNEQFTENVQVIKSGMVR